MTSYPDNPPPEIASQRDVLFDLFSRRKFGEAADMALSAAADVNLFMPIENIADRIRKNRPDDALKLYDIALDNARLYAANATSGAEGSARSQKARILESKVAKFRNEMKK